MKLPGLPGPNELDVSALVAKYWGRGHAKFTLGAVEPLDAIDESPLGQHGEASLHDPAGGSEDVSAEDALRLIDEFGRGRPLPGTLKIAHGAHPALDAWQDMFVGAAIRLNSYFSTGPSPGLRAHYDDHHVFAIQLVGEKTWHVGPVVAIATPETPSRYPVTEPAMQHRIGTAAGDALYLPPGMWHAAETPQASVHVTVGIYPPTYAAYSRELVRARCATDFVLRSELAPVLVGNGATRVGFKLPNRTTVADVTARLGRTSVSDQQGAGGRMQLVSDGRRDGIDLAAAEIWDRYREFDPVAVYLRGSAGREADREPWDLDFVLVTRKAVPPELASRDPAAGNPSGGAEHELDLECLTVQELARVAWHRPVRHLLASEGVVLRGEDVVANLPPVPVSPELADLVAQRQARACRLYDAALAEPALGAPFVRRAAKAALRLASPGIMRSVGRFERNPSVCAWYLKAHHPEASGAVDTLMLAVGGERVTSRAVQEATRSVLDCVGAPNRDRRA